MSDIFEDIKKININLNNTGDKFKISDDIVIEKKYSTISSLCLDICCSETFYDKINKPNYFWEGNYIAIGWIDIHNSGNDGFQLYIKMYLPDILIDVEEKNKYLGKDTFDFLYEILNNVGFNKDNTLEADIFGETKKYGLTSRTDVLY